MKLPSISGTLSLFLYDSYTKMEPNRHAIITRSGLYSASILSALFAIYYGVQGKREAGGGLGACAVVFYLSARYAPLSAAKAVAIIALSVFLTAPIVGLATQALKNS